MAITAVILPAALGAQTRVGGMGPDGQKGKPGRLSRDMGITIPKIVNPINLLIEHRLEVALNDTQFTKIVAIKRVLDSTNAPMSRKLDSIARLYKPRPIFSSITRERRDSIAEAHPLVLELVAEFGRTSPAPRTAPIPSCQARQLSHRQGLESVAEQANSGAELPNEHRGRRSNIQVKPPE
jgi:hypothetical protein